MQSIKKYALFNGLFKALNKTHKYINSNLSNIIILKTGTSASTTIAAGAATNIGLPTVSVTGYKNLGCIAATPNGNAKVIVQTNGWAYNPTSAATTITASFTYLFIRDI